MNYGMMSLEFCGVLLSALALTSALHIYERPSFTAVLFLICALLAALCHYKYKTRRSFPDSMKAASIVTLSVLAAQCAVLPFYFILASRFHSESLFAALSGWILNLFGVRTVAEGEWLYIDAFGRTLHFLSSWEKVGILFSALLLIGSIVLLLLKKSKWWHYFAAAGIIFVYTAIRYALLIMFYTSYVIHNIFWMNAVSFVTFIPCALLLWAVFSRSDAPDVDGFFKFKRSRTSLVTCGLAFTTALFAVCFIGLNPSGGPRGGSVLVDEFHSDWEWTTEAYDENWYGERSGYNYYCFYEHIARYFDTRRNMSEISDETLSGVDVLVMKTPTRPFSDSEVDAIESFVRDGGGLYLIGDHTNVFGTGNNLNQLSKRFGITFNLDATYELTDGSLSEFERPALLPHQTIQNLPHFLFATSCTLSAPLTAHESILGYGLKTFSADYSQKNFFPKDTNGPDIEFGLFLQSAAVEYGSGRVLAFTDSTVFSNFWMFMPGKPELLIESINWLDRYNAFQFDTRTVFFFAMLASGAVLAVLLIINRGRNCRGALLLTSIGSAIACALIVTALNGISMPAREPIKPFTKIAFEDQISEYKLPRDLEGFMSDADRQLNTFYVWTQRLGYVPSVAGGLAQSLRAGDLAVLAKPREPVGNTDELLMLIENGARLLILDNVKSGGNSEPLLSKLGMRIENRKIGAAASFEGLSDIPLTPEASAVVGGIPLMTDDTGNSILSVKQHGKGLVAVFTDPDLFYSLEMGDVSANLTERTEKLARLEFALLRNLIEQNPDAEADSAN